MDFPAAHRTMLRSIQRARYMPLQTIATLSDDATSLSAMAV
jgi:hypothetical protein